MNQKEAQEWIQTIRKKYLGQASLDTQGDFSDTRYKDGRTVLVDLSQTKDQINSLIKEIRKHQMQNSQISKEDRIKKLSEKTLLAEREAEVYVLTEELEYSRKTAAKEMGISTGNLDGKRGEIKEKIQEAEKTAELGI